MVSALAAGALAIVFLVSGAWKLLDLEAAAERMVQALIPVWLASLSALGVAVCETSAGILLLVRRYRRWGAIAAAVMLLAFMAYIGVQYERLLGEDCNCFPWIRRVVGPVFFVTDAAMLALAAIAGSWAEAPRGRRGAFAIVCGILLLGTVANTSTWIHRGRLEAPATISADGRPFALREGRVFLYFFDPECADCYVVARQLARRHWGGTRIVAVPTREPRFAPAFLGDTGLRAAVSGDAAVLRAVFAFADPPYLVVLDRGRVVARLHSGEMEGESWFATLAGLGFAD